MNLLDRVISYINPVASEKREAARVRSVALVAAGIELARLDTKLPNIVNSGYDESGASYQKKSLRGWRANSKSPQSDIDANLSTLRNRSRALYMGSPLAAAAVKDRKNKIVGPGLRLKCKIDFDFLGITREAAHAWEKNTERLFDFYASSVFCDVLRLNNFYEMQPIACGGWLINGDSFGLLKYEDPAPWFPWGLRLQLIESDRVSTPYLDPQVHAYQSSALSTIGKNTINGNDIYNGVEIDKNTGAVVAYWVCNMYPNDNFRGTMLKWNRVEAFGAVTGMKNVLQIMDPERCEQYRGVPFLAPVIEELKQITRYSDAELSKAIIHTYLSVFVKTELPTNENPFGGVTQQEEYIPPAPGDFELGPGTFNILNPNESIELAEAKSPSNGFESFVLTMAKIIGAALETPYEVFLKCFNSSYSASRAALLEMWEVIHAKRSFFVDDLPQPFFEVWLTESVARGIIQAPGFFNDPFIKAAWCKAEWLGPVQGQLDCVKEAKGAEMRVNNGFSTRSREATEINGTNFDENVEQLRLENEVLNRANGITPVQDIAPPDPIETDMNDLVQNRMRAFNKLAGGF